MGAYSQVEMGLISHNLTPDILGQIGDKQDSQSGAMGSVTGNLEIIYRVC